MVDLQYLMILLILLGKTKKNLKGLKFMFIVHKKELKYSKISMVIPTIINYKMSKKILIKEVIVWYLSIRTLILELINGMMIPLKKLLMPKIISLMLKNS